MDPTGILKASLRAPQGYGLSLRLPPPPPPVDLRRFSAAGGGPQSKVLRPSLRSTGWAGIASVTAANAIFTRFCKHFGTFGSDFFPARFARRNY